ncbi:MAG: NAD(P)-binding protein, partial [Actinobacteria bacterium]|nr:NAD(P)-binding protein [Actinomycetota bacterium]
MRQFGVDEISGDLTEHTAPTERTEAATLAEQVDVVVVGAGLAGLTAAAVAARTGCRTVVLDAHRGGGRAAVRRVPLEGIEGHALFNDGPRALYLGGPGVAVLDRLGVRAHGAKAPTRGSAAIVDGRIDRLPTGLGSMMGSRIVATSSKPTLVAAMAGLATGRVRPGRPEEPTSVWIHRHSRGRDDVGAVLGALFRLATYTDDLDELSADAAVAQVVHAVRQGVSYLDGGFQQLLDG